MAVGSKNMDLELRPRHTLEKECMCLDGEAEPLAQPFSPAEASFPIVEAAWRCEVILAAVDITGPHCRK